MPYKTIKDNRGWITRVIDEKDRAGMRFYEVLTDQAHIKLEYPGYQVSDKPMFSENYHDCNGVVLLGKVYSGLSHYDIKEGTPEEYIQNMVDEISTFTSLGGLCAVLLGGDTEHFNRNKRFLENSKIPIVGSYLDGRPEDGQLQFNLPGDGEDWGKQDLVVLPKTREVILYKEPKGYLQLA